MDRLILIFVLFVLTSPVFSQETPVEYMNKMGEQYRQVSKDTWDYTRQAARGRSAGKTEKRRKELIATLQTARNHVGRLPGYNGETDLRDAARNYLDLSQKVLSNDFQRVVDMEKIAEQSYDLMEAYLLTMEQVSSRMDSAFQLLRDAEQAFAGRHNVKLVSNESKLSQRLSNASEVNTYHNKVYLIFFKSFWYEQQMIAAMESGKVSDIEQHRQTLETVTREGQETLKSTGAFRGYQSLRIACDQVLTFFLDEATRQMPAQIDFHVQSDRMNTLAENFKSKNQQNRTKQEVDEYNKQVDDFNKAVIRYNQTNTTLNNTRNKTLSAFEKARDDFFSKFL